MLLALKMRTKGAREEALLKLKCLRAVGCRLYWVEPKAASHLCNSLVVIKQNALVA